MEKRIEEVKKAIEIAKKNRDKAMHDIRTGKMTKDEIPGFGCWLEYESVILSLETKRIILESINETDKTTKLAYRVSVISLVASMIAIVSSLI
jgi:hypothetical protein